MAVSFKINLQEDKLALFDRALRPKRRKNAEGHLTASRRSILGKIFAYSHTKNEDAVCRVRYDQLQEDYELSRSTVSAALRALKDMELIEEVERDRFGTAYRFIGKTSAGGYYPIPQFLYTLDVYPNGTAQRLTKAQIHILSYLMYRCRKGDYVTSARRLAKELDFSEATIKRGLRVLLRSKLIYRPAESKGKNGHKLSAFIVNSDLYNIIEKAQKRAGRRRRAGNQQGTLPQSVQEANARAERERFYALRRQEAQARLDRFLLTVPDVVQLDRVIAVNDIKVAKEELGKVQSNAARIKAANLRRDRAVLLERYGVREEQFDVKYHCICKKCSDTGACANGAACDCYQRE